MTDLKRIAVFCASRMGNAPVFSQKVAVLGSVFSQNSLEMVYGGADSGLMRVVANSCLENDVATIGVFPKTLVGKEAIHSGLTELIEVETMQERKTKMEELSDGFLILPGGYGTLDELFEMLTWRHIRPQKKPISIWNLEGFYDAFLDQIDHMLEQGFISTHPSDAMLVSDDLEELIEKMKAYFY